VLVSAFGTITNGTEITGEWGGSGVFNTVPLNTGVNLQNMTVAGNSLVAQQSGWYLVNYSVDGSGPQNNFVTYQLQNAAATAIPNTTISINTTANDLEQAGLTTLVYLNAGDAITLASMAQSFGPGYLPAQGASITAVKISN
jgi:hypothetical protein